MDYTRNVSGQINSVTTTQGASFTTLANNLAYQPFGPVATMEYGNGLNRSHSYDLDYRLTLLTTPAVLERNYTYDMANNITAITNALDATRDQVFAYDLLNRLTDATGTYGDFDYTYDANSNRLTSVIDTHVQTYSYDTASHHLIQTVNGGTREYSYDANGNTLDNTDRQFSYGNNNRLKQASLNNTPLASYVYNGKGERVKKQSTDTTLYYYDQSGQLIAELDAAGNTLREYLYLDGQPLAYVTNNTVNFIHTDHLGTPQRFTNASQTVVWQADYEPFGAATITTETVVNNLRAPGQYWDVETGLLHNGFRTLSPEIGRYLQSDLIGLRGGFNTYAYVNSNPINSIDPTGLTGTIVLPRPIPLDLPGIRPFPLDPVLPIPIPNEGKITEICRFKFSREDENGRLKCVYDCSITGEQEFDADETDEFLRPKCSEKPISRTVDMVAMRCE